MWFNLALLSAAAKASNQAITKRLSGEYRVLEIAAFGQFAMGLLLFPLIFIPDAVALSGEWAFHKAAWATILLNVGAIILLVDAIRRSDLSYALPFLGLTPVFTILTGWLLRGENIALSGMAGIVIVVIGALGIDVKSIRDWITFGGRRVFSDKGVGLVILVSFIYAVSSVYDKTATLLSDPLTFVWYSSTVRTVIFVGVYTVWVKANSSSVSATSTKRSPLSIFLFVLIGLTFAIEALSQMYALQTGLVAYVIAVKRLSIVMTSAIGLIVFKEQVTWSRFCGAVIMVIGAAIIYCSQSMA